MWRLELVAAQALEVLMPMWVVPALDVLTLVSVVLSGVMILALTCLSWLVVRVPSHTPRLLLDARTSAVQMNSGRLFHSFCVHCSRMGRSCSSTPGGAAVGFLYTRV